MNKIKIKRFFPRKGKNFILANGSMRQCGGTRCLTKPPCSENPSTSIGLSVLHFGHSHACDAYCIDLITLFLFTAAHN